MDISVVGAGRVGTALAVLLQRAGHRIVAVAGRDSTGPRAEKYLPGVPLLPVPEASAPAGVVLLGVPDSMIEPIATDLQLRADAAVVHLSGALGLEALRGPEAKGHTVVALHPLQTFPTVMAGVQWVPGSSAAITARTEEGFALGERLAVDVGARPFRIPDDVRPLYHAGAVLASGAVVALLGLAESVFAAAGVDDAVERFRPLTLTSVHNVSGFGLDHALTGPVVRGDNATVERNLRALAERAPGAVPAYVALSRTAVELAVGSGRLDAEGRRRIEEVLARWT